jgi:uncharacterized Zn finger protein
MSFYGWKPYVPVAKRREQAEKKIAQAKKSGKDYAPIAAFRGALAKTFWGKAWCDNLERYSDYANRLPRGRTYVRNGSVIDLQIQPGKVTAQVMGSSLYKIEVAIDTVAPAQWEKVVADCAGSIHSLVELLQGKLTKPVMERIAQPKDGLFPAPKEICLDCSCPDWATMCKHVAAALYGIGTRLDAQPELLFVLRGVDASELIGAAAGQLDTATPSIDADKVLADDQLADVFGIELAAASAAKPKAKKPAVKKPAAKPAAKPATKPATKPLKKTTAKTSAKAKAPAKTKAKPPAKPPAAPRRKASTRKVEE